MLPCRSARFSRGARLSLLLFLVGSSAAWGGDGKRHKGSPSPPPEQESALKNIPLTVGHEAKGLVLPNYDLNGQLLGKFEAATAARVDDNHVRFTNLKMITYGKDQKPDFNVDMSQATLDLETRVIDSQKRTKLKRADFEIAGDTMQFNTLTHQGTMTGNVRMTIFNQKEIAAPAAKR